MKIAAFDFSDDRRNIAFSLGAFASEIVSIGNFLNGKAR
jgi:hypothetical protein